MLNLEEIAAIASRHADELPAAVRSFDLAGRRFGGGERPGLMGVVNLSPDSWYRESVCLSAESAIRRGRVLAAQGADLIDLGAESSLAQAARSDEVLQNSRLLPVIRELARDGLRLSVETYRTSVARSCLEAGARVLNLTGTAESDDMFRIVADHDAAVILCYVAGPDVRTVGDLDLSGDVVWRMKEYFSRQLERAERAGVLRIWIDPGLGFYYRNLQDSATRIRHQMGVFLHTFRLRSLGWPTCHALPHAFECFEDEVRCAEPFFAVLAALGKTDLFRTHEVPKTRAVLETLALWEEKSPVTSGT